MDVQNMLNFHDVLAALCALILTYIHSLSIYTFQLSLPDCLKVPLSNPTRVSLVKLRATLSRPANKSQQL